MTDPRTRTRPAAAAKVMVTGVSISSVLAMTAAMGSATSDTTDTESIGLVPVALEVDPQSSVVPNASAPSLADEFSTNDAKIAPAGGSLSSAPRVPTIGQVMSPSTSLVSPETTVGAIATTIVATPAPVVAPAPIVVQIPTPVAAPTPSASTSKSK